MEDRLIVPSFTGVDVELDIAGPGGRSYAFVIDWHLRALLAIAWWIAGSFLYQGAIHFLAPDDSQSTGFAFVVIIPASAIYFLYHPVLEIAMRGRTPGKRMAGVRVVKHDGTTPDAGALLIRNVFRLVDSLPGFYVVGLTTTLLTERALRIGDMAAGTVLVYEESPGALTLGDSSTNASAAIGNEKTEIARDLLDRWDHLAPTARKQLAGRILGSDAATASPSSTDRELRAQIEALLK